METIQAIFIPDTETRLNPNKHTEYRIQIYAAVRNWTVWRRYSEFCKLNSQLRSYFPKHPPPIPLPGKSIFPSTFGQPDKIEERRQGLEKYLRGMLSSRDDRWRETNVWKEFLAIPTGRALKTNNCNPESWLDEYNQLQNIVRQIRSLVSKRTTHIAQSEISAAHNCTMQGKKLLLSLSARLSNLENGVDQEQLADGEARRRQDMLEELKEEKDALMKIVNSGRVVEKDSQQASEQKRQQLVESPRKGGRRAFGPQAAQHILARETQETRGLDNEGLVNYQKQVMQDQDQHIEQFSAILTRQRQLGLTIGDELKNQSHILDDLDDDVGRTGNKLKAAKKKLVSIK